MLTSRRDLLAAAAAGLGTLAAADLGVAAETDKSKSDEKKKGTYSPTIWIDNPLPGTTLGRQFAASGRYSVAVIEDGKAPKIVNVLANSDVIDIKCTLRRQDNTDVKTVTADWDGGFWIGNFSLAASDLSTPTSGMKLIAVLTINGGVPNSNEVGSLTIDDSAGVTIVPSDVSISPSDAVTARKLGPTHRIGKTHKPKGTFVGDIGPQHVSLTAYHKGTPIGARKSTSIAGDSKSWTAVYEFKDDDHNQEVTDVVTVFAIEPATGRPRLYSAVLTGLKIDKSYAEPDPQSGKETGKQ
jgi:hypothetical protein